MSDVVIKDKVYSGSFSRMAKAINDVAGKINTDQSGLYHQRIIIQTGDVTIDNDNLDVEFDVPFDDDTEANEAVITIYNLTANTINAIKKNAKITITAGYNKDTGTIFSGYISKKKSIWENADKVTTIYAIDNNGGKDKELTSIAFAKGTKASAILKKLVGKVGLPVGAFKTKRDHTYKDKVTVSGSLTDNIKKYARICGVSAFVCKSKIYVAPLTYGEQDTFNLTYDTGLLMASDFEEEVKSEDYTDTITGLDIEMLLQHKVQTGSYLLVETPEIKGSYRVREGSHTYDGNEFKTVVKAVSVSSIKK